MTFKDAMGTVPAVDPHNLDDISDHINDMLDHRRAVGEVIKGQLLPQYVEELGRGSFAGVFKVKFGDKRMVGG